MLGRVGPHQGHQPLAPVGIIDWQQQKRLQWQASGLGQLRQPLLKYLRKHGFTAAVNGPIKASQQLQPRWAQPAGIATAPPAIGSARQGLEPASLQPARTEPLTAHLNGLFRP